MDKSILIIDDTRVNREILKKMLSNKYNTFEAENGLEGLRVFEEHQDELSAVILDLVMPVMDGYEFLEKVKEIDTYGNVPIFVATGDVNGEAEDRCLELGASDFIQKPYRKNTLELRLEHVVNKRHIEYLEKIKYLSERDDLTGMFNKKHFSLVVKEMVQKYSDTEFALVRLDIDQFRLFNTFFGIENGNLLLKHVATVLEEAGKSIEPSVFGRAESDIFLACIPFEGKEEIVKTISEWSKKISAFNSNYCLELSMGIYLIEDIDMDVENMYACASTAARKCKNLYMESYVFFDKSMNKNVYKEQIIMNNMQKALDENQLVPYIQPKFNLEKEVPYGGEALIRWNHPEKGLIPPGEFIPVFEKNGFIVKIDYFMWESVCKLMRKWIDQGLSPDPISVNMSRVSLYNPHVAETIKGLVEKYDIPPRLLNLEVTESAYMDNPELMKKTITSLKEAGFIILMDDFGSGYSSLNTLKDIDVDILKIDMKFLPTGNNNRRSEKILVSVIRMAGWLGLPVVVEGVETEHQKTFLKNVGCEYVQGYYFDRPMPVAEYEELVERHTTGNAAIKAEMQGLEDIWEYNPNIENLLRSIALPVAMYEYTDGTVKLLRTNYAFETEFEYGELDFVGNNDYIQFLSHDDIQKLKHTFGLASETKTFADCEYYRIPTNDNEEGKWYRARARYVKSSGNRNVLCVVFSNITQQKVLESEMKRIRTALGVEEDVTTILVVDDNTIIRSVIKSIFDEGYNIIEAANGQDALNILDKRKDEIDIILLDVVMPIMGGEEFLKEKNKNPDFGDIPVVCISSDDDTAIQTEMLKLGVNDYVTKPFIPEVMERRVKNVMEYNSRFRNLVKEYDKFTNR